ncbi:hydroxyethylthiazole kinase [Candidatus Lariskella endosymbiont of Epinotia ramella]|uniref:hydroxyethylthiazole kinase n=1 Tax=Candidatus Lariskella endosymbiont of Epinotia ramella TaxID=3066224 RepID=UPI0030CB18F7
MLEKVKNAVEQIKKRKPLILCLTNYVSVDFVANSLLALGASPIMSCDSGEIVELVKISSAININIGTLNQDFIKMADVAAEASKDYNKPLVLDPVGAGASLVRTKNAVKFAKYSDIIRGNASEIIALFHGIKDNSNQDDQQNKKILGVDSVHQVSDATDIAKHLVTSLKCCVAISGKEDFIIDETRSELIVSGEDIMQLITGMGCAVTAVIAAFKTVIEDRFEATKIAMLYFGLCANLAYVKSQKPGIFKTHFIDEIYGGDFEDMRRFYVERS